MRVCMCVRACVCARVCACSLILLSRVWHVFIDTLFYRRMVATDDANVLKDIRNG